MRLLMPLILTFAVLGLFNGAGDTAAKTALQSKAGGNPGPPPDSAAQGLVPSFITVHGADLRSKIDSALKLASLNSNAKRFWVGYSFAVRSGVAIDTEIIDGEGKKVLLMGANVSTGSFFDTRNLGVFLLYNAGGNNVTRMEIYNLDRPREFGGYAVYWLGRAENEESFDLLKKLVEANKSNEVAEGATMAIALHDDGQVNSLLENVFRNSSSENVRRKVIFWLGQNNMDMAFFANIILDEGEDTEVRRQAAFAIGVSKDRAALATLKGIYDKVANHQVKMHIIFAASVNGNKEEATSFLNEIASTDADSEAKKLAEFWLWLKSDNYSPEKFSLKYRPPM